MATVIIDSGAPSESTARSQTDTRFAASIGRIISSLLGRLVTGTAGNTAVTGDAGAISVTGKLGAIHSH